MLHETDGYQILYIANENSFQILGQDCPIWRQQLSPQSEILVQITLRYCGTNYYSKWVKVILCCAQLWFCIIEICCLRFVLSCSNCWTNPTVLFSRKSTWKMVPMTCHKTNRILSSNTSPSITDICCRPAIRNLTLSQCTVVYKRFLFPVHEIVVHSARNFRKRIQSPNSPAINSKVK